MEKLHYVFNAHRGTLENEEEVIVCEPFFGSSLCHGIKLIRDTDFIVLGEIAVAAKGTLHTASMDDELIGWIANKINEFKEEESISLRSKDIAVLIVDKVCESKGIR